MTASKPRALVVGFGSIGAQHARILTTLGFSVSIVSRRGDVSNEVGNFRSIADAVSAFSPGYVVLATETATHGGNLEELRKVGYAGPVLVEKPLFDRLPAGSLHKTPTNGSTDIFVGYQLRFDPIIVRLRHKTESERCISAEFYVGQHLSQWRPGRGARDSYSGHATRGGGVLRDLSHELDLAQFLFGRCQRVAALGGRLSDVTADSDDAWGIVAQFERCPIVSLQLNYLDPTLRRRVLVVTESDSICADLVSRSLTSRGTSMSFPVDRSAPLVSMHRSILERQGHDACDFASGLRVVAMIDAIERAARTGTWVEP